MQCAKEGSAWTVQKRYSQFYGFEQDIKTQVAINAPFPGKLTKITSLTTAQKEERRLGINTLVFLFFGVLFATSILLNCGAEGFRRREPLSVPKLLILLENTTMVGEPLATSHEMRVQYFQVDYGAPAATAAAHSRGSSVQLL